jgi:hypothetical protein
MEIQNASNHVGSRPILVLDVKPEQRTNNTEQGADSYRNDFILQVTPHGRRLPGVPTYKRGKPAALSSLKIVSSLW